MKRLLKIALVLLVLLVAAAGVGLYYADEAARRGIERAGTDVLGVETTVDDVDLSVFGSDGRLARLRVANPPGFSDTPFLDLGEGRIEVALPTLMDDLVVIPSLVLDGVDLSLEMSGASSNYQAIIDHMKARSAKKKDDDARRYVVKDLRIKNIRVRANLDPGIPIIESKFDLTIPEIVLQDVGSENAGGVLLEKLGATVVEAVLAAVGRNASALPPELRVDFKSQLQGFEGLQDVGRVLDGAGQAIKTLDSLFGGEKK